MRSVCYVIQTMILKQGEEPQSDENIFFGPLDDVVKELKAAEKLNAQAQITHAGDPEILAVLKNKEQVLKVLLTHDLDQLPVFPRFGQGQGQCRFECCPTMAFVNQLKVSIRGAKGVGEPVQKPINIVLPPGVRL